MLNGGIGIDIGSRDNPQCDGSSVPTRADDSRNRYP